MVPWLCAALALAGGSEPATLGESLAGICAEFSPYDRDKDGSPEIAALSLVPGAASLAGSGDLVLVLVERRLAEPPTDGADLTPVLAAYVGDLAAEGWRAAAISCQVYAGDRHQDGSTILALREFLRRVAAAEPRLQAVVLVGSFPDAFIVRQFNWWQHNKVKLNAGKPGEKAYEEGDGVDLLRSVPEPVVMRGDLVLADLDGRWENVYHQGHEELPYAYVAFPQGRDKAGQGADAVEEGKIAFEDFFLVNDGHYALHQRPDGRYVVSCPGPDDAECAPADMGLPNPIAKPDVWVSRLDARHASVIPDPSLTDRNGRHLLADDGTPQTLEFASPEAVPHPLQVWVPSEATERTMLAEWFARRHRFRLGEYAEARKPANIGVGWGDAMPELRSAFPEWKDFREDGYDILRDDVNLLDVVEWLKRPAVARAMKAHGDPWGCSWTKAPDVAALEQAVGPRIYNWRRDGNRFVPSLAATAAKLDFAVTRSVWESHTLPDSPAVWLYTACEGTAPAGAAGIGYNQPGYGFWQSSECIVFHLGALALIGRSKVFYDEPRDMWAVLGSGGTMGEVWRHYFDAEAGDPGLFLDNGIGRKRAYFWNVVGDCTVRLRRPGS